MHGNTLFCHTMKTESNYVTTLFARAWELFSITQLATKLMHSNLSIKTN